MSSWEVFLSFAYRTNHAASKALKVALESAGIPTFRLPDEAQSGVPFAPVAADALLGSKVVVVFLDSAYLEREHCRWELNGVLAAPDADVRLVVARPSDGAAAEPFGALPPRISGRHWPRANDTTALVALDQQRLGVAPPVLATALGEAPSLEFRNRMLDRTRLPVARNLASIPHFPDPLPSSIGEAFVGRSEALWQIDHTLRFGGDGKVGRTVALVGAPGTGKTQLAREYVGRYGSHFGGGIFWVDGTEPRDKQLHSVLRAIDPGVPALAVLRRLGMDLGELLRHRFRERQPSDPVLWVIDDLSAASAKDRRGGSQARVREWCPIVREVALLITSQQETGTPRGAEVIRVNDLSLEDARALLLHDLEARGLSETDWRSIATSVGRLPLALVLLNGALRAGAIGPQELLDHLRTDQMVGVLDSLTPPLASQSIGQALSVSLAGMTDQARRLARVLAQFAPDPIPEVLIERLGGDLASPAARTILLARGFVARTPETEIPCFGRVNELVASLLRAQSPSPSADLTAAAGAITEVLRPDPLQMPRAWPLLSATLPHALVVASRLDSDPEGDSGITAASIRARLALFELARGDYRAAQHFQEQSLEARRRLLGSEDPETLAAAGNLAAVLQAQGDYPAARALLDEVLEARRRLLGPAQRETLVAAGNLANLLYAQGDYAAARDLQERVVDARARMLGPEHPDTLAAAGNLANLLYAEGDYAAARDLQERVLEAQYRQLGTEHSRALRAAGDLAATLDALGDFARARELEERVLEARQRTLGPEHPETLSAATRLAQTLRRLGDIERGLDLQARVSEAQRRRLGPSRPAAQRPHPDHPAADRDNPPGDRASERDRVAPPRSEPQVELDAGTQGSGRERSKRPSGSGAEPIMQIGDGGDGRSPELPQDYWASHEVVVSSLDEYLSVVEQIANRQGGESRMLWRGVSDADWPLHSSLVRKFVQDKGLFPDEAALQAYEQAVLAEARDFGLEWHQFGGRLNALELLATLQHFEIPTRMLDFTSHPLIALWFAAQKHDDRDGRVFAVEVGQLVPRDWSTKAEPFWTEPGASDGDWRSRCYVWRPPAIERRMVQQDAYFVIGGIPTKDPPRLLDPRVGDGRTLTEEEVRQCMSLPFALSNLGPASALRARAPDSAQPGSAFSTGFTIRIRHKVGIREVLERLFGYTERSLYPDLAGMRDFGRSFPHGPSSRR